DSGCPKSPANRNDWRTFGLTAISRYAAIGSARRILRFRALGTVLGTALLTICYAGSIQAAAHGVITHTGKVFYPAAADQYHGVFLQVMPFTTDVGADFITVGQTHTANLTQCRVRLLRCGGVNAGTNPSSLRATLQSRNATLGDLALSWFTNQLVDSCHSMLLPSLAYLIDQVCKIPLKRPCAVHPE